MHEIDIRRIENIRIGNAEDAAGATGCTVILCENGAPCGVDIRGGGPASRETPLLDPRAASEGIHAVLLSGGSAFGLDAAGGVMRFLEERDIGFPVGVTKVPLVCQSSIFDLVVGSKDARPDTNMGYAACESAWKNQFCEGNHGAGTGATVGKLFGTDTMMKSGLGAYAVEIGELKVGAVVVVNALGNVYDPEKNISVAGLLNPQKTGLLDTAQQMYHMYADLGDVFTGNTTIGAVITNAGFDKAHMGKVAAMAHNGYVRTILPVNTTADGDSIYALSVGNVKADINVVGTLAAHVVERAVLRAVWSAEPAYGLLCAHDLEKMNGL